jgi:hypothetical protein
MGMELRVGGESGVAAKKKLRRTASLTFTYLAAVVLQQVN